MNIFFNWFFLALLFAFFSSAASVFQKAALKGKDADSVAVSIYFPVLVSIMALPVLIFDKNVISMDFKVWLVVALRSLMYLVGILYFKAMKEIEVSEITIISSTRSVWVLFGGALVLGEALTINKAMGVILIVLGIATVYWNKEFKGFTKYHLYIFIYSVVLAMTGLMDKYLVPHFSLAVYQIIAFLPPALATAAIIPSSVPKIRPFINLKKHGLYIILAAFLYNIGGFGLFGALKAGGEISKVSPISQSSTMITVLLGILILKERTNAVKKIVGAILTFAGIVLIKFI